MQSEIRVQELASEETRTEMQSEIRVQESVSIRLKRRAVIRED
jgi:hypothetical protein